MASLHAADTGTRHRALSSTFLNLEETEGEATHLSAYLYDGIPLEIEIVPTGTEPLKVTVAWSDPPALPVGPALDPPDRMLVHVIDLDEEKVTSGDALPAEGLALHSETPAVVVGETQSPPAKPSLEDSVLLAQIVDGRLLVALDPAFDGDDQESPGMNRGVHCGGILSSNGRRSPVAPPYESGGYLVVVCCVRVFGQHGTQKPRSRGAPRRPKKETHSCMDPEI